MAGNWTKRLSFCGQRVESWRVGCSREVPGNAERVEVVGDQCEEKDRERTWNHYQGNELGATGNGGYQSGEWIGNNELIRVLKTILLLLPLLVEVWRRSLKRLRSVCKGSDLFRSNPYYTLKLKLIFNLTVCTVVWIRQQQIWKGTAPFAWRKYAEKRSRSVENVEISHTWKRSGNYRLSRYLSLVSTHRGRYLDVGKTKNTFSCVPSGVMQLNSRHPSEKRSLSPNGSIELCLRCKCLLLLQFRQGEVLSLDIRMEVSNHLESHHLLTVNVLAITG